jgi:DNA-binding GntR family transcriptional regulator
VRLQVSELEIEQERLGPDLGRLYELDPETRATTVTRVLLMDGQPGARMTDVVRPGIQLPAPAKLRQALERGQMVLDVLLKQGVPVAYNRSHIAACVLAPGDPVGTALGVTDATAALRIEHVTCTADGAPVEHSTDIFLPRSLDLHVVRWLEDVPPVPAIERAARP